MYSIKVFTEQMGNIVYIDIIPVLSFRTQKASNLNQLPTFLWKMETHDVYKTLLYPVYLKSRSKYLKRRICGSVKPGSVLRSRGSRGRKSQYISFSSIWIRVGYRKDESDAQKIIWCKWDVSWNWALGNFCCFSIVYN